MKRISLIKPQDTNNKPEIEDLLNKEYLSHFIDLNAFKSITFSINQASSQLNLSKQNKELHKEDKIQTTSIRKTPKNTQNQQICQPLTTLLNIKKQNIKSNRNVSHNSPNSNKNNQIPKIDQLLNNRKKLQNQDNINVSDFQKDDTPDKIYEIQTFPQSNVIKYTITNDSLSTRSIQNKKYSFPSTEQGEGFIAFNQELQNVVSLKSINKQINIQKTIFGNSDSFTQPQRVLKPFHKQSTSLTVNSHLKLSELNNAKNSTQNLTKSGNQKSYQVNQTQINNKNQQHTEQQSSNSTLIMGLLENEKNQDQNVTQNYNKSLKIKSQMENKRKIFIPLQSQYNKEEEQKFKYMKKMQQKQEQEVFKISEDSPMIEKSQKNDNLQKQVYQNSTDSLQMDIIKSNVSNPNLRKVSYTKLSITNPIFTETDKSSLLDRSQQNFIQQWQLKLNHKDKVVISKNKYRILSASTKIQDKRYSSPNPLISSSFLGIVKDNGSSIQERINSIKNHIYIQDTNQYHNIYLHSNFKSNNTHQNTHNSSQIQNASQLQENNQRQNVNLQQNSSQIQNNNHNYHQNNISYQNKNIQFQNHVLSQNIGNQFQKVFQNQNNCLDNKNKSREEENISNQGSFQLQSSGQNYYHKNNFTYHNLNQDHENQKQMRKLSVNQLKHMIHPELQSFINFQNKSGKDLTTSIIMTQSQNMTQSQIMTQISNKQQINSKQANFNTFKSNKSNPIIIQEIQLLKSKSIENQEKSINEERFVKDEKNMKKDKIAKDEKIIKEATSNLSIYKYTSNNYRPQTAKIFSQESSTQKQKNKQIRSFNSLKSWENNDNDDQSVLI